MSYHREMLPEPQSYFENAGLVLRGRGKWRSTACTFHGGSSMRVNLESGAWVCMSCAVKGGDVLAYEMQTTGAEFVEACRALGAWIDDGRPQQPHHKPAGLSPRAALEVVAMEAELICVAVGNVAHGVSLTSQDLARVMDAGARIIKISESLHHG